MSDSISSIGELTERNREIFRRLVETYLETGDPVGSRTLSRRLETTLSAASVRNIMQDLEALGLLAAPHVSAGRVPTEQGLRLFIDGLLRFNDPQPEERAAIERALSEERRDLPELLDGAGSMLSDISRCAAFVVAPKQDTRIRHVQVASLGGDRALMVLVGEDGAVENRLLQTTPDMTPSAMEEATNFLNAHLRGLRLGEARAATDTLWLAAKKELDALAARLIEDGFAEWSDSAGRDTLVVRGLSNLLEDVSAAKDLDRLRRLFDDLERHENLAMLLNLAQDAQGVRVFIGSENDLYSFSDSSLVLSSYADADRQIVGAIGVIGPKRLNYARIVPIVDYTARLVGRLSGELGRPGRSRRADAKELE